MKCPNCGGELTVLFDNIYQCEGCHKIFTPSSFAKPHESQPQQPPVDTPVDTPSDSHVDEPQSEPVAEREVEPDDPSVSHCEETSPESEPVSTEQPESQSEPLSYEQSSPYDYSEQEEAVSAPEEYISVDESPIYTQQEPSCYEPSYYEPSYSEEVSEDNPSVPVCPRCGAEVKGRFCPECGYDINKSGGKAVIACPVCKHSIPADAKFCTHCGWRVGVKHNVVNNIKYSKPVTATKDFIENNEALNTAATFVKTHKKIVAIVSAALAVVIIAAIVLGAVLGSTTGRLNRVSFSSSVSDVKRIMGAPDEIDETSGGCTMTWYYGVANADEAMEAGFSDQSFGMAEIKFSISDGEERLRSIYYSPDCLQDDEEESVTLEQDTFYQYGDNEISDCWYRVDFTHGGYYKALIGPCSVNYDIFTTQSITIRDIYGIHSADIRIIEGKGPDYNKKLENSLLNDENFTIVKTEDGFCLTGLINTSLSDVTIPDGVTSIGYNAFYNCTSITRISIPDSVTIIDNSAFNHCSNLSAINIPNGVTNIGNLTFADCNALTRIELPNSVTSIGNNAFSGCRGLTSITIPDSVTSIGQSAFSGCSGLICVTIGNGVTSIGSYAFSSCSGLTSITIPDNVTSIGNNAFYGCSGLTSIIVAESNPNYSSQDGILYNKDKTEIIYVPKNIQGSVTIPNGVTSIGDYAFDGCSGLTSITIPDSVTSIGNAAFYSCSGLTSITIPNSVTSIDRYAFYGCTGLTSITIPDSVTSIGLGAFGWCNGLTRISIPFVGESKDGTSNTHFGYIFGANSYSDNNDYVPSSLKTVVITGGTSIGEGAFSGCRGFTSITIPDSVTSIGNAAFGWCNGLTSITIPDSVTSIGLGAFYDCSGLTSIEFEDPSGWYWSTNQIDFINKTGGSSINLSDSADNASNLSYYFAECYFYKK